MVVLNNHLFTQESFYFILAGTLLCVWVIVNYAFFFLPLALFKKIRLEESQTLPSVSVVICARNEEDNLLEFLPKVLMQDYPEWEVVVVNDCSEDQTDLVLNEYARVFPHLKVVHFPPDDHYKHGKKMALLVGIKSARHEHLVFTDADCYPTSDQWLKNMVAGFTEKKKIVIGYSSFEKEKSFLNLLIRFDGFWHGVMYLSAAIGGKAYMATGRNMGYVKSLFFRLKGFSGHYHIASGDDDLFINQASDAENTNVCIHPDSIIRTPARKNFSSWKWQKARHLSTSYFYTFRNKFRLIYFYGVLYTYYIAMILHCILHPHTWWIVSLLFFTKSSFLCIFLMNSSKKLKENQLFLHAVYMEFIILVLYPYFHLLQKRYKPEQWTN